MRKEAAAPFPFRWPSYVRKPLLIPSTHAPPGNYLKYPPSASIFLTKTPATSKSSGVVTFILR